MTIIKLTELKKELHSLDHKELIQLISELYKVNKDAQQFLSSKFKGEEAIQALYEKTKKEINNEFFPDRGFGKMRLAEAKKAILNFKKLSSDELRTADLMLYCVELGTKFTNTYGDIDARFYNNMTSMYSKVVEECNKNETLYSNLKERLYMVVDQSEGIGWGYHDVLREIYYSSVWLYDDTEK